MPIGEWDKGRGGQERWFPVETSR